MSNVRRLKPKNKLRRPVDEIKIAQKSLSMEFGTLMGRDERLCKWDGGGVVVELTLVPCQSLVAQVRLKGLVEEVCCWRIKLI